ncbi:3-methyl-2-oxobutanoate hydroxymethyltransferase [Egicoccus halophilus]|uniref:3-methyl-2-oxobutanoate hydroxymethyltransferase n=1 Tax=Egicoccus halophilus TaxID=1670830 RepID=A0A8J3AC31_9ACTN|nr:3-methyl-2-oxobutanoate hydroxymethyltransferase [Egicoccus halophilus]
MSVHVSADAPTPRRPVSIHDLRASKQRGEKFVMLTAYDHSAAALLDELGVPVLLVGDSLGMVVLGYESTVPVTLDEMLHHTRAVARGAPNAVVVGDLPFGTYQDGPSQALASATRLLKEAGATAVKLEGGGPMIEVTAHLVRAGIPVMGHLGLTPQSVHQFGGFKVQGRDVEAADQLVADAVGLADAGAFAIVLECVPTELGARITEAVDVPTIGIGAGPHTDGQVLVWHDLLGLTTGRLPRFVKPYADLRSEIAGAVKAFSSEVADGEYPGPEHRY